MRIYLDSSVYLKGFIEEERSDIVEKVFDRCKEGRLTIIISIWTLSECISVLDKGVMNNRISSSQMNDILTNMLSYTFNLEREDKLVIVEPNADIIYHS
jgi:predicted nucleic acid-binding protein